MKKLLAANVNIKKAREVCHLSWPEICKIIPGIEHVAPITCLNPPKKSKTTSPKVRVKSTELLSRPLEPSQTTSCRSPRDVRDAKCTSQDRCSSPNYWRPVRRSTPSPHPFEYEANQEYLRQPYRSPQTYTKEALRATPPNFWEDAGPSQEVSPSLGDAGWQSTYRAMNRSMVGYGAPNCCDTDLLQPKSRHDATPLNSRSNNSYERTQSKYGDIDALLVKVRNEMRADNRDYDDRSDVKPINDQPYKDQQTSSETSLTYWPEPDRPTRSGLRNETHRPKRDNTYNYFEEKKLEASKYQEISWDSGVNPDRPLRGGLRNETQTIPTFHIDDDSNGDYRDRTYKPPKPVHKDKGQMDFSKPARRETKSEIESHYRWNQGLENRETFEDSDANGDIEPIHVAIHNVIPMIRKEMTLVHQRINLAIARIGVQGAGPKFSGSTYKSGCIVMNCENQMSRNWLEKKVPTLKPWPEAYLYVTPSADALYNPFTLTVLIPNSEGVSVSTALELLRIQNPGLDTKKWKVLTVRKVSINEIVLVSVDEGSFKALKYNNFKANLGINKVSFWVRSVLTERDDYRMPSVENDALLTSSVYTERDNNSTPHGGENTAATANVKRKRRRTRKKKRITQNQTIDNKPSLLGRPVLLPNSPNLPQASSTRKRPLLETPVQPAAKSKKLLTAMDESYCSSVDVMDTT